MSDLHHDYVSPRIEIYELESESFLAASGQVPVDFGNGGSGGGWTIQKGGSSSTVEEELL
jgi:hypothetical protein